MTTRWLCIHPGWPKDVEPPTKAEQARLRFVPSVLGPESHVLELEARLKTEMRRDYPNHTLAPYTREHRTEHWLDWGGSCWAHRKIFTLPPVDGLTLDVPATDVQDAIDVCALKLKPHRHWTQNGYRTLPTMLIALLVERRHLELIRTELIKILPEALAHAAVENARHNEIAGEAAQKRVALLPLRKVSRTIEEA
jgi:hypothetical protein